MDKRSIWKKTTDAPSFPVLEGRRETDVLIIGGGITGVLCAYQLQKAGVGCVLLEARRICGGVTENTTAKITLLHGAIYDRMIARFGLETAKGYLLAQEEAMREYASLAERIECDFERCPSFVYSRDDCAKIKREVAALKRLGCRAEFYDSIELPFEVAGAVGVGEQAQFHPLKLLYALAKDLPIYENSEIIELREDGAVTKHGRVCAKRIIVATHFPFLNQHGSYFLKLYQHRSYVIALENATKLNGSYVDENEKGMSFRTWGDLLLLGGGGHRTGKPGGGWQELEAFARSHYPGARVVARWATQDCMTLDEIPYIGQYSAATEDLYVATGYNKWGMTSAMVAARLLCDLVRGRKNRNATIFSPSRSILRPQLALNVMESVMGILTPTVPRCTHLGCALKYNAQEHSWDCPCHGSRFDEHGKLINNPATRDKKFK
ncbi:MAG: FAD-dependent oxidoreductase [Clostridia bacterium]|nr:FAD-dependent oxidoreductase [Clostridia bacterium]